MPFDQLKRREFITLLGGVATWPLGVRAQEGGQMCRVGVLSNVEESDPEAQSMIAALHQTLRELGWVDGRNIRFDHRWAAGNPARILISRVARFLGVKRSLM